MAQLKKKYMLDKWRVKAATNFQRLWRGFLGRRIAIFTKHTSNCIVVQKIGRGFCGRRLATSKKRNKIATTIIQKQWRGYIKRTKYQEYMAINKEQLAPCKTIQRCARTYVAKVLVHRARHKGRAAAEKRLIAEANIMYCEKRARIELLLKSVYSTDEHFDGLFQEFFQHWCGEHSYIENAHFIKWFKDAPGIIGVMFKDMNTEKTRAFTVADLDLMFSKKKAQGTKHLTYVQFVELLDVINATIFSTVKEVKGKKGKEARMLETILSHMFTSSIGVTFRKKLEGRAKVSLCGRGVAWRAQSNPTTSPNTPHSSPPRSTLTIWPQSCKRSRDRRG